MIKKLSFYRDYRDCADEGTAGVISETTVLKETGDVTLAHRMNGEG